MSEPRVITFDLDDTLWAVEPVIREAELQLHDWFAQHHPGVAERFPVPAMRDLRRAVGAEYPHLAHDLSELRLISLRRALVAAGYDASAANQAFDIFQEARNRVTLYDDVPAGLRRLAAHFRLGTISNGNADIERVGLGDYFAFTISAREARAAKPDPAIFRAAVAAAGCAAMHILHVGDDPVNDIQGARAAGMGTALMVRGDSRDDTDADYRVASLLDLADALGC
ncbi:MAG: HAD-IA family hydrolase [Gammaproteobacteria bacterium]